jgi:glyoxylase-like metal-dependent hydrolase (beta-lactamase superfamily II)
MMNLLEVALTARRRWLIAAPTVAAAAALVVWQLSPAPLPAPAPFVGELPPASPPPQLQVFALPTAVTHRSAGYAYRGGAFSDKRDFAMTAVLVKHPNGNLLIDTGLSRDVDAQLADMPFWFRAQTSLTRFRSAAEQLAGVPLRGVLLTHAHWDHVSGLSELGAVTVWVTPEERRFVDEGGYLTATARGVKDVRWETYPFDGGPYLGFEKSNDVFGDGSVVVVPATGHTPGSVIVFLALPDGRRYALLGDLVWQLEGITELEERPFFQRTLGDFDLEREREAMLKVSALAQRFPSLTLVPAHDARGFATMARLSADAGSSPPP